MTPAAAAILDGPVALFSYAEADAGMRNIAVVTLRQLGYGGQAVAEPGHRRGGPPARRAAQAGRGGLGAGAGLAPVRDQRRRDRPPARGAPVHGAAPPGPPRHPARTAGRARPGTPAGPPCGGTGV